MQHADPGQSHHHRRFCSQAEHELHKGGRFWGNKESENNTSGSCGMTGLFLSPRNHRSRRRAHGPDSGYTRRPGGILLVHLECTNEATSIGPTEASTSADTLGLSLHHVTRMEPQVGKKCNFEPRGFPRWWFCVQTTWTANCRARNVRAQQGTIFGLLIPRVAFRVSTTSCDSSTIAL